MKVQPVLCRGNINNSKLNNTRNVSADNNSKSQQATIYSIYENRNTNISPILFGIRLSENVDYQKIYQNILNSGIAGHNIRWADENILFQEDEEVPIPHLDKDTAIAIEKSFAYNNILKNTLDEYLFNQTLGYSPEKNNFFTAKFIKKNNGDKAIEKMFSVVWEELKDNLCSTDEERNKFDEIKPTIEIVDNDAGNASYDPLTNKISFNIEDMLSSFCTFHNTENKRAKVSCIGFLYSGIVHELNHYKQYFEVYKYYGEEMEKVLLDNIELGYSRALPLFGKDTLQKERDARVKTVKHMHNSIKKNFAVEDDPQKKEKAEQYLNSLKKSYERSVNSMKIQDNADLMHEQEAYKIESFAFLSYCEALGKQLTTFQHFNGK